MSKLLNIEHQNAGSGSISPTTVPEVSGAGCLLQKYLTLLYAHLANILPPATCLAEISSKHFAVVSQIVIQDVAGMLKVGLSSRNFCRSYESYNMKFCKMMR